MECNSRAFVYRTHFELCVVGVCPAVAGRANSVQTELQGETIGMPYSVLVYSFFAIGFHRTDVCLLGADVVGADGGRKVCWNHQLARRRNNECSKQFREKGKAHRLCVGVTVFTIR